MTLTAPANAPASPPAPPFLGLAPFLRMSIAGADLRPVAQALLAQATGAPGDANLWMNLSIAMQCLEQRDLGLAMQAQALALQRVYHRPAAQQPPRRRLLMLMVPGDVAANTPLECLLEHSDIALIFYYLSSPENLFAAPAPAHDALIVALGESDDNRALLAALEPVLAHWPRPVINAPQHIPATRRNQVSALLRDAPGVLIPPTLQAARTDLRDIATGKTRLGEQFAGCDFPIILRPVGSQAGRDLDKVDNPEDIGTYLAKVQEEAFFIAPFTDYSGADGLFRKFRIAMVDGRPFACHMAVSAHWMVHYVNAGMYEDAHKRAEEAQFMADFDTFCARHRAALEAIYQRMRLDYFCIDAAQTRDGRLLVFEIDHIMVVHAMDLESLFPYKQVHMRKVQQAFCDFLLRITPEPASHETPSQ